MTNKMPWKYRIALVVIVVFGLLMLFLAGYSVYRLVTAFSIAPDSQSPAPDTKLPTYSFDPNINGGFVPTFEDIHSNPELLGERK